MPKLNTKSVIESKVFAKKYVENGLNGTKTIQELRPNQLYSSARTTASEMIKRPEVQREIQILMEQAGLTKEYLVAKAKEGLNANVIGKEGLTEHADHNVRHKYLNTALKLYGELDQEDKQPTNQVNIGVVYIPREQEKPVKHKIIEG